MGAAAGPPQPVSCSFPSVNAQAASRVSPSQCGLSGVRLQAIPSSSLLAADQSMLYTLAGDFEEII